MMSNKYFENLCMMPQPNLKMVVASILRKKFGNKAVTTGDGFVFAQGDFPVCLVAHMDTVHREPPKQFVYEKGKLSSPQGIGGDDRCGIYIALNVINHYRCSVLFLEDEEIGCVGASKFVKHPISDGLKFNYMIELDRRGSEDAVFYECDNPEFEDFIIDTNDGKDWAFAYGSCSDISTLAPAIGCAAVNLSCGYYQEHTKAEYVILSEMENCIQKVCRILERTKPDDCFEYIEAVYNGKCYSDMWGLPDYHFQPGTNDEYPPCYFYIAYMENKEEKYSEYYANSDFEALGMFFVDHSNLTYNDVLYIENYGEDVYSM